MNAKDLVMLRAGALAFFKGLPIGSKLPGMSKPLNQDDARLIAIYEATLQVLNSKGAFKDGWLEANPIKLLEDDSNPGEEDYL